MAAIDIGAGATNRGSTHNPGYTLIDLANPANGIGVIDTLQIWANATLPIGTKIGTFYLSGGQYACRAYYTTTSTIVSGAVRTLTGLSIAVQTGDYLGIFYSTGMIERDTVGGSGLLYKVGDQFGAGLQAYLTYAGDAISIYGTGSTVGEAPTVSIETIKTGTATLTTAGHLIDTTLNQFVAGDVGRTVKNTTNGTYAVVLAYNSPSDLTIFPSIMISGKAYRLDVLYLDQDSFTVEGAILDVGLDSCHTRGFCYMQGAGTPTIADQKVYDNGTGTYGVGAYFKAIAGLNPGTLYSVRAFATNAIGTGYSVVIEVTTRIVVFPTAITQPADPIGSTITTINGKISEDGGASCEARFGWRVTTPFPYTFPFSFASEFTETDWQNSLVKDSLFHEDLTGLTPETTYSFRTQARSWTDAEEQIISDATVNLYAGAVIRSGQKLFILDRMVTTLSFYLSKTGLPTGDITFTIRKVSDDSIINSKVWGDASALDGTATKRTVTFDTPVLINEEVRILVEFSNGDEDNLVQNSKINTNVKADEGQTFYSGSSYTDYSADGVYEYTYHLTGEWSAADYFTTTAGVFELAIIESLRLGDNRSEIMTAGVARTDGLKAGGTSNPYAMLERLDGIEIGSTAVYLATILLELSEALKVGGSSLIDAIMSLSRTDGISLDDIIEVLTGAFFNLSRTDGLKVGDTRSEQMAASVQSIEGIKVGDTRLVTMLAALLRTDGMKINDTVLLELAGEIQLAIIDGIKIGDAPELGMIAFLTLLEAIKIGDIRATGMLGKLFKLWLSTKSIHDLRLYTETFHDVRFFTDSYHNVIIRTGEDAMTVRSDWQRGETIPIWAEVRLTSTDALYNPDQGVLIYVYDPTGTVIATINGVAMDYSGTVGYYVYYWNTAGTETPGWYRAKGKAQDGTGASARVTIENGGFNILE